MKQEAPATGTTGALPRVHAWRARALNSLAAITAFFAVGVALYLIAEAIAQPQNRLTAIIQVLSYLVVLVMATLRRVRFRLRAWGILLAWYTSSTAAFISYGLLANGPLALLSLPVIALMIVGRRTGIFFAVLDLLTFACAGVAAHLGWLPLSEYPPDWIAWAHAWAVFFVALLALMWLQWNLSQAQEADAVENFRLYAESERLRTFNESIVQNMEEGILLTDATGRITFANPAAARQLGSTVEALRGRPWVSLVAAECAATVKQEFARHAQGIASRYEATLLTEQGEPLPVLVSAHPMSRDGRFDGLLSIFVDISERKKVETVLRESEERLRAILDASEEAVFLIDDQSTVLTASQPAARMFERNAEDMTSLPIADLLAQEIEPSEMIFPRVEAVRQVFQSGQPIRLEGEWSGRFYDATVRPIVRDGERPRQVVIFARDVTDRRLAEQRARRAERLAAMGYLAAALAHEINNPIQAMRTNLELALNFGLPPEEQRECLRVVLNEIESLSKVTHGMLDFAQPTQDTRYPVSLAYLVRQALLLTDKQMRSAHIHVTADLPDELPIVQVAPNQIGHVLLNLIINAIEAMPDGGHLHIAARAVEGAAEIAVTDDGPALPPEHLDRVFEPFFTTKPGGFGLGLAISHSIVQQHGGTISVQNVTAERGVTFTVRLPVGPLVVPQEVRG